MDLLGGLFQMIGPQRLLLDLLLVMLMRLGRTLVVQLRLIILFGCPLALLLVTRF